MRWKKPDYEACKRVKAVFPLLPKRIGGEVRWLEKCWVYQHWAGSDRYIFRSSRWRSIQWVNGPASLWEPKPPGCLIQGFRPHACHVCTLRNGCPAHNPMAAGALPLEDLVALDKKSSTPEPSREELVDALISLGEMQGKKEQ